MSISSCAAGFISAARAIGRSSALGRGDREATAPRRLLDYRRVQLIDSGDPLRDPFYEGAHKFSLFVPACNLDDAQRQMVQRITEASKPAHTQATIVFVEPRFRVGVQAFVGVDTVIGAYPDQTVTGAGALGSDTVLSPGDGGAPTLRIGSHSRIGSSTVID